MVGELIQIYYDDDQLSALYPFATPCKNEALDIFFENSVIAHLVPERTADKISICSWRLREKMAWQLKLPRELTQSVLDADDYDVLSFTNNSHAHKMLAAAEGWHPGFTETLKMVLESINQPLPFLIRHPIYQNHFSARADIYKEYVATWLQPAINAMKNDATINARIMIDSKYIDHKRRTPEFLQDKIGIPYYPLAPFILERLFSVYCASKNINITWL